MEYVLHLQKEGITLTANERISGYNHVNYTLISVIPSTARCVRNHLFLAERAVDLI